MKKLEEYVRSIPDFQSRELFSEILLPYCRMQTDFSLQ